MKTLKQYSLWVVADDAILCHQGVPYRLMVEQLPTHAIALLPFGELDLPSHVIGVQYAIDGGLLVAYGKHYDSKTVQNLQPIGFRALIDVCDVLTAHACSHAISLVRWYDDYRFCGRCGAITTPHHSEYAKVCTKCHNRHYPHIQPCVIVAILGRDEQNQPAILLAKHNRHASHYYGLIAGFMETGESVEMAIGREVKEEVGLSVHQFHYFGSQSWPYPSNLMLGFIAHHQAGEICIDKNELLDAQFFAFDKLPALPMVGSIAYQMIDFVKQNSERLFASDNSSYYQ